MKMRSQLFLLKDTLMEDSTLSISAKEEGQLWTVQNTVQGYTLST